MMRRHPTASWCSLSYGVLCETDLSDKEEEEETVEGTYGVVLSRRKRGSMQSYPRDEDRPVLHLENGNEQQLVLILPQQTLSCKARRKADI